MTTLMGSGRRRRPRVPGAQANLVFSEGAIGPLPPQGRDDASGSGGQKEQDMARKAELTAKLPVDLEAQISFFDTIFVSGTKAKRRGPRVTNSVELYDLAPKFAIGDQERLSEGPPVAAEAGATRPLRLPIHRRTFVFHGEKLAVEVTPARLVGPDGISYERLPGRREQVVEHALRALSIERKATMKAGGDQVGTMFSIAELRKKLSEPVRDPKGRTGTDKAHTLSNAQLKESLQTLNRANLTITSEDGQRLVAAPFFPEIKLDGVDGDNGLAFVRWNPLVSRDVEMATHRQINYDALAASRNALSVWLQQVMMHRYRQAGAPGGYRIGARNIIDNSGMCNCSVLRDNIRAVRGALKEMVQIGFLDRFEEVTQKTGKQISDVLFTLFPSKQTIEDTVNANRKTQAAAVLFNTGVPVIAPPPGDDAPSSK
jgi:hypothetical protein